MTGIDPRIRRAWENRNLIPVVGAGVAKAVAGLPDWKALLEKGIAFVAHRKASLKVTSKDLKSLRSLHDAANTILGFSALLKCLGGPDAEAWEEFLRQEFADPTVQDPRLLHALRKLTPRVIVSTNCDLLLKEQGVVPNASLATWLDPKGMLVLLRSGSGIIHLHGRYDHPRSVIFSEGDYTRIGLAGPEKEAVTRALFHAGVLLFIGCSLDGVSDPHLYELLTAFGNLTGPTLEESAPHFLLVRGKPTAKARVRLRRLGIEPVSYGESFDDLPGYLESVPTPYVSRVFTSDIRDRLHSMRHASNRSEVLADIRTFLQNAVFPNRTVRIGFAELVNTDGRTVLRNQRIFPPGATHNEFSYPQTLAAWALIEGRILAWPKDLNRLCDFKQLRKLNKYNRVRESLMATDPSKDAVLAHYLDADEIKRKTLDETLSIADIYQHWVGQQDNPHYGQFVSVPVPVVDKIALRKSWPEHGVLNIDCEGTEPPLLSNETEPLLKLASDLVALACEHFVN